MCQFACSAQQSPWRCCNACCPVTLGKGCISLQSIMHVEEKCISSQCKMQNYALFCCPVTPGKGCISMQCKICAHAIHNISQQDLGFFFFKINEKFSAHFLVPKIGLPAAKSKNRDHFFMPISPQYAEPKCTSMKLLL